MLCYALQDSSLWLFEHKSNAINPFITPAETFCIFVQCFARATTWAPPYCSYLNGFL